MRGAVPWMKARKEGKNATPEAGEFGLVTSKQLLWQRPPRPFARARSGAANWPSSGKRALASAAVARSEGAGHEGGVRSLNCFSW